jgi:CheY-like chemotaxis protein
LVAEDNEINQIVIQRQLEALGHDITVVENGAAAMREWLEDDFDIILTDCHMPEIDGFELTQRIRQIEARRPNSPRTPIIAITANALSGEEARCRAVGMDGYLSKPVKLEEMGQMIQALASPTGT